MPRDFRKRPAPAVAACAFEVDAAAAEVQLLPAGRFRAQDGRPTEAESWVLDADIAARVITRAAAKVNRLVIDYEHQTLHTDMNGQPAPAAGWFKALSFRPDSGLWATDVEWTERARTMIAASEYRYLSAVFSYLPDSGEVLQILNAGLTNSPALDGLAELQLAAAAKFHLHDSEEEDSPVKEALLKLLGLKADTSDEAAIEAVTALKTQADSLTGKEAEIAALKAAEPDPAKYVPIGVVTQLKNELTTLRGEAAEREVDELVTTALSDGRLLPAQEEWARSLGASNIEALKSFVESAQPIAALKGNQTRGKQPENAGGGGKQLTDEQLAVCRRLGLNEADYLEALPKE